MIHVYLDPDHLPLRLNEQFLLPWWVQVPPNLPVSSLTVELTTTENLVRPDSLPPQLLELSREEVASGKPISIDTPLRFNNPGHYAVRLRVSLTVATLGLVVFRSRNSLKLNVERVGEKLKMRIESQSSVLIEADRLHDYAQVDVNAHGPVLVDLSKLPTPDNNLDKAQQVRVREWQLPHEKHEFQMLAVTSEWKGPDVAQFWQCWQQWFANDRPMRELKLLAADGGPAHPVRVSHHRDDGRQVKLRLMTQHPSRTSHLFLLSQSAEGNFMQCAPNLHGQVTMTPSSALHYPKDFFGEIRNEEGHPIDGLRFDRTGWERFLAVVTSEPLVDPVQTLEFRPGDNDAVTNLHLPLLEVSRLLNAVWNYRQSSPSSPDMEIGFLEFEVFK